MRTRSGKDTFFLRKDNNPPKCGRRQTVAVTKASMRNIFLFIIFLTPALGVQAQQVDWCTQRPTGVSAGGFKVNGVDASSTVIRGCAPFKVTIQNTTAVSDKYIYEYKGGDPLAANSGYTPLDAKEFVYQRQGTYRILQLGSGSSSSGGSGSVACQTIEVYYPPNYTVRACSGRRVQVTIADDSTTQRYDEFLIDWGGGRTERVAKTAGRTFFFTYANNVNSATIFVQGIAGGQTFGCDKPSSPLILNNANLSAVQIQKVTARPDGLVDVLAKGAQGVTADLQISDNNGNTYRNTGLMLSRIDTLTLTVRDIDANKNLYCFRLSANDGCEGMGSNSNVVCSINLDVKAENRQNVLTWTPYPNNEFRQYLYNRNNALLATNSTRTTSSYTDRNVVCTEQYCYQVTAQLANGSLSVSALKCVKAISDEKPSAIRNPFVQVSEDDKSVEIRFQTPNMGASPNKYKAIYYRAPNGSNDFKEIAVKDNSNQLIDSNVEPTAQSYCYKIEYENACGNRSDATEPLCTVWLHSKSSTTIDWTPESPFLVPVGRYVLDILDENGNLVDQIQLGLNTRYDPNANNPDQQLFRYRILAYTATNSLSSHSNYFVFKRDALLFVPDAFSPNGDGVNDDFKAMGLFLDSSKMIIFNRWGQPVFETESAAKGWNGTINNLPAPEGTYVYRVEITDSLGKRFVKVGTLLLVR